ncbi:NAD-P-binding protein [Ceratobasidium sp. AG-I]|nr:NAD-P-binding protein [Ceratobasidium sp. AG-I]
MLDYIYSLFSRLKTTWRQHYPADQPAWTVANMPDLSGRVVFVTGGLSGIGFEMCKAFLAKGATVYVAGRNTPGAQLALNSLSTVRRGELKFIEVDLASLHSTRAAAQEFLSQKTKLDLLVNNAAEYLPPADTVTAEGYDLTFGVNCIATCFLTLCLLPCLLKTPDSRIINLVSEDHRLIQRVDYASVVESEQRQHMDPLVNHGQSKLGLMLFANELHRRYHKQGLISVSVHPGTIRSNRYKHKPAWLTFILHRFMYPAYMGALTPLWAATSSSSLLNVLFQYVLPWGRVGQCAGWAEDPDRMKELWAWVIDQTVGFQPSIAQFK